VGKTRNTYRILIGKHPLGRMRLEDNVKMDISVISVRMGVGWNWIRIITTDRL
jgi:hypothetical protein